MNTPSAPATRPEFDPKAAPSPELVLAARLASGLTQTQAAQLVHYGCYQRWMECERGRSKLDVARWELFLAKTGLHPSLGVVRAG